MRHLRYFVAIAEEGSLSKAAERVRVAQPALSQHMRNMEMDLGTELLFRSSRGVKLTEAGERLAAQARVLIQQFDELPDIVRGTDVEPAGEVRFGVPGTVSQVLTARLVRDVAQRFPKIKLRVAEAMSGFILDWLREGKVDIGVLYRRPDARGLQLRLALQEELRLFGASGSDPGCVTHGAVRYRDAIDLPLVVPSAGHGLRDLLDEVAAAAGGGVVNATTEIDSYVPIKKLVEEGMGYSILPAMAIKAECAQGRLSSWAIIEPELRRDVFVAVPGDKPLTAATQAVEAMCHDLLTQLVAEGVWDAATSES
ncbi:LysR family transcriptional regulator [Pararhizobium haloflavum]|uniref:LysR family transcriptional regulator n=1 Tax=Pararhizobium haloflavum TaxID=2037914 RepID=UPI001FDF7264|nr:LysR family transcriptional regulator [Pararhizobium haloflavum]